MQRTLTLLLFAFVHAINLLGQSSSTLMGAKATGLGYATATMSGEWALFNNVAGISTLKEKSFGSSFEVRPRLPGANRLCAMFMLPFSFGVTGIGVYRFGNDAYSEQMISAGYANRIGNTSLGAKLSYIQYKAEGFGARGTLGLNVGGITQITKQISIGAWMQNINQPKINFNNKERAPVKMFLALSIRPSDNFQMITEIEKDVLYRALWKTGFEYAIHKKFFARAGINIHPNAAFFGIGYLSARIKIDYAMQSFTTISTSHQASFSYQFNSKKKGKS